MFQKKLLKSDINIDEACASRAMGWRLSWLGPTDRHSLRSFTSTLVSNDPLQTLFQLMSGRIPQAATVQNFDTPAS